MKNEVNTVQEFNILADNPNVYDYAEAYLIMENYVLSGQNINNNEFKKFVTVFAELAPKSDEINFYPLNMLMWRKSSFLAKEQELFDEINCNNHKTDINSLTQAIDIIDKTNNKYSSIVSNNFIRNFQSFIIEKIKVTDFTSQDIEQLSQTFANCESRNLKLQKMYQLMPDMMRKTQNEKIGKEIHSLNKWAFEYKNDDLSQWYCI